MRHWEYRVGSELEWSEFDSDACAPLTVAREIGRDHLDGQLEGETMIVEVRIQGSEMPHKFEVESKLVINAKRLS